MPGSSSAHVRPHGSRRQQRLIAALALPALGLAACSVATPRNGLDVAMTGGDRTTASGGGEGAGDGGAIVDVEAGVTDGGTSAVGGTTTRARGAGGSGGAAATGGGSSRRGTATTAPRRQQTAEVGVTAKEIKVSIIGAFSGAYKPVIDAAYRGLEVWQRNINDAGGINGRTITLVKVDGGTDTLQGREACKRVLSNGSFLSVNTGSQTLASVACQDEAGFVNLYGSSIAKESRDWKSSYSYISSWDARGATGAALARARFGDDQKHGLIYVSSEIYSAGRDAYVAEARRLGMNVVGVEGAEATSTTFTPQLIRLRDAGATVVTIIATIETISILRDAQSIRYTPKWNAIGAGSSDIVSTACRDLCANVIGVRPHASVDVPAAQEYAARHRQYYNSEPAARGEQLLFYGIGGLLERVLRSAGPTPTRATLREGIGTIKNYDNGILPPITWGVGDYHGTEMVFPVVCCRPDWYWRGTGPAALSF